MSSTYKNGKKGKMVYFFEALGNQIMKCKETRDLYCMAVLVFFVCMAVLVLFVCIVY